MSPRNNGGGDGRWRGTACYQILTDRQARIPGEELAGGTGLDQARPPVAKMNLQRGGTKDLARPLAATKSSMGPRPVARGRKHGPGAHATKIRREETESDMVS